MSQPSAGTPLILLLAAVTATGPMAMHLFLPALPLVQREMGETVAMVQWTISGSMIAIALATLVYGPLSDRFGRKPVLMTGLVLFLLGSSLCALAQDLSTLIIGRLVQAAGGAAGMVLARAVVRDVFGDEGAARAIAQLTMVMVVAPMVAPAIGGLVTDELGWRAGFWLVNALVAGVLLWVIAGLSETLARPVVLVGPSDMVRGFAFVLRSRAFACFALYTACSSTIFFGFISGVPYLMVNVLERPAADYGLWFILASSGFMAGNYIAMGASARFGHLRLMQVGSALGLAGILVAILIVLTWGLSPAGLFLPATLSFVGNGLAMPNAQAGAIGVHPHRAGTASGFVGFAQMLFAAIAAQLVGVLQDGTAWPMLGCMLVGALGAIAALGILLADARAAGER